MKEYYEKEGRNDSIYIYLRPGSYVPVFHYKTTFASAQPAQYDIKPLLAARSPQIAIAILPFRDLSGSPLSLAYARAIPDELAFLLMRAETWRVISPVAMAHLSTQEQEIAVAKEKAGAHLAFEGSVREEGNKIRVTARIIDAYGFQLWVKRLDAAALRIVLLIIKKKLRARYVPDSKACLTPCRLQTLPSRLTVSNIAPMDFALRR